MSDYVAVVEISQELRDLVPLLNLIGPENNCCAIRWNDQFGIVGVYRYFSDGSDLDDFIARVQSDSLVNGYQFVDSFVDETTLNFEPAAYGNLVMSNIRIMHDNLGSVGIMDTITYAKKCLTVIDTRRGQASTRSEATSWLRVRDRVSSSIASMSLAGV